MLLFGTYQMKRKRRRCRGSGLLAGAAAAARSDSDHRLPERGRLLFQHHLRCFDEISRGSDV